MTLDQQHGAVFCSVSEYDRRALRSFLHAYLVIDDVAGRPLQRIRLALFVAAWLYRLITSFRGPVAFLGIVAAQVTRGMFSSADHRVLSPGVVHAHLVESSDRSLCELRITR